MKNRVKRVCALLLAIMMLMSTLCLNVFAGSVIPGTKDEKIHLGWKYFEYDEDNETAGAAVQALEAGKTYCVRLAFFDNPSDENSTVIGANISVRYDAEAVNIPDTGEATVNSVFYEYQGSFIPNNDGNGLLTITLATTSGIRTNRGKLVTAGNFFEAVFNAKTAVLEDELKTLFQLGSETNKIFDVNEKDFTIVECPAFTARVVDNAQDFFPTTTAEKIAENLVGEYIDENGNATVVNDFTVELPATGLVEGENVVKVSYNGYTCDVTITVVGDTMQSISVTGPTTMTYKTDDTLDLTGLVVTAAYESGETKTLTSNEYTTSPANGTTLKASQHNGKPIIVTVGSLETSTDNLTVNKKSIAFTLDNFKWVDNNGSDIMPGDDGKYHFPYDGNPHGINVVAKDDATDAKEHVTVRPIDESDLETNAGEYKKFAGADIKTGDADDYELSYAPDSTTTNIVADWVIDKATFTPDNVSKDVSYGTTEVTIPRSDLTGVPANGVTIAAARAASADTDRLIAEEPTVNADGSITLKLRQTDVTEAGKQDSITLTYTSDNYETESVSSTITINIVEKTRATVTVNAPTNITYGDSDSLTSSWNGEGEAVITASMTGTGAVVYENGTLTATQAGYVDVTLKYESATHFGEVMVRIIVDPRPITVKAQDKSIAYGDTIPTAFDLVLTNGTLANSDTLAGLGITASTEATASSPVGTYPITLDFTGANANYTCTAAEPKGNLSITAKQLTAADITVSTIDPVTYNGQKHTPTPTVSYGGTTLTSDQYDLTYGENTNAGKGTVIVTLKGNYSGTKTVEFTIEPKSLEDATLTLDAATLTYNTKPQEPGVTVTLGETTLTAADYNVSYSADHTNAGTVTVTVTGKSNYTGTKTATFEIKKADLKLNAYTISELCTETDTKTRTLPSDFFLAGETTTGFSITLTAVAGGDEIFAETPAVVEGKNEITFKLNGKVGAATFTVTVTPTSGNYNIGSYTLTISTYDRTDVSGSIEFKDGSAVYTGSGIAYERATLNGNSFNMAYSYSPASTGAKLDEKGLPLTVGTYTVTAIYSDANSYGSAQAVFTITKATPTGTPTCTKFESSGKTLADTELSVGTIRPAGTIAWNLPLTTVLEDGKAYAWTFTPNDTHNYTTLTGTLIPYVDDGMDYIPGVIGGSTTGSFTFHDVSRSDYFYNAVKWAAENGIASGTSRYSFSPDAVCTRAQTVTFLWRAAGSPLPRYRVSPFTDVNASDYYYNAVLWAVEQGITTGLNATTFGPDETVTRGQVATFLYRAASAAKPNTFNPFTDVKSTAYNYDAILWAYDNRITTGTSDTTFSPDAFCTRAQIVTFLYRFYQGR